MTMARERSTDRRPAWSVAVLGCAVTAALVGMFSWSLGATWATERDNSGPRKVVDVSTLPCADDPDPDCYFQVGPQRDGDGHRVVVVPVTP